MRFCFSGANVLLFSNKKKFFGVFSLFQPNFLLFDAVFTENAWNFCVLLLFSFAIFCIF